MAKDNAWTSPEGINDPPAPAARTDRGPEPQVGDPIDLPPARPDTGPPSHRGPEPRIAAAPDTPAMERPPTIESVDDSFPGLYDRSACRVARETDALRTPDEWVDDRNPGYPDTPGRNVNCGDCARASELTWRGIDTQAAAIVDPDAGGESVVVMDTWSPGERVPLNFMAIHEKLEALGPGSSAIVGVDWQMGGGHWFNAFNDGGRVRASDGQKGVSETWPASFEGLGFDEEDCMYIDAIFISSDGHHLQDHEWR